MSESSHKQRSPRRWLRVLIFAALSAGLIAASRKWAISKADQEFEARLRAADETRN